MKNMKLGVLALFIGLLETCTALPSAHNALNRETEELLSNLTELVDRANQELYDGLFDGIKNNNFKNVKDSLEALKKINPYAAKKNPYNNHYNFTPLAFAILFEADAEIIQYLLEEGADAYNCLIFKNSPALDFLISESFSALAHSLYSNNTPPLIVTTKLIQEQNYVCNEEIKDEDYVYQVAKLLTQYNAKFNEETIKQAQGHNFLKISKLLAANLKDKYGHTPLWQAVTNNDIVGAKYLLDLGADATLNTAYEYNPVTTLAASKNNTEMVKLLLDYGAKKSINIVKATPLSWAMSHNNEKLTRLLLDNGACPSVTKQMHDGMNPIHQAIIQGNITILQLVLKCEESKAAINVQDNKGETPLLMAVKNMNSNPNDLNLQRIQLLLGYGAGTSIGMKNNAGQSPLSLAQDAQLTPVLDLFAAYQDK